MTKELMVGGVPVKFTGNAATAYRYKQLFQRDLIRSFLENGNDIDIDMITELAYVMHLQADGSTNEGFNAVSFEDYLTWLDGFEFIDLMTAAPQILGLWADTSKQTSKVKKK